MWKIHDISRTLDGVDDDFDVPDQGWCPWWHNGWSANALRERCLKFGGIMFPFKASRTLSKMDAGGLEDPDWYWCHWSWLECVLEGPWSLCLKFHEDLMTRSWDMMSSISLTCCGHTDRQTDTQTDRQIHRPRCRVDLALWAGSTENRAIHIHAS